MSDIIKLNTNLNSINPDDLSKNQEIIFTLKDQNILDYTDNNEDKPYQVDQVKFSDNNKITIERYDENELLKPKKENFDIELKDDGQIIDEDILLNKFDKLKSRAVQEKKSNIVKERKFQNEYYSKDEMKLINKKRKKKQTNVIFDLDNEEEVNFNENKNENTNFEDEGVEIKLENEEKNFKENNNKSLMTSEDKQKLQNMFKNNNIENNNKKTILFLDESYNNNDNDNIKDNINEETEKNKKYNVLDDYTSFLDNLPAIQNNKNNINSQKINNDNNNKNEQIQEKKDENKINEDIINSPNNENEEIANIINNNLENNKNNENVEKNEDDIDYKIPLIDDEPPIRKGVCIALTIFRNKHLLGNEIEFGRFKDKNYNNINNSIDENDEEKNKKHEINIEYRDEQGKKLKPKEMARYQFRIFHGEKSSVRKREKSMLRDKYRQFVQDPQNTKTMEFMNYIKNKNNVPFATIQGKSTFL